MTADNKFLIGFLALAVALVVFAIVASNAEREHMRDCDRRHGVYVSHEQVCADSILVRY